MRPGTSWSSFRRTGVQPPLKVCWTAPHASVPCTYVYVCILASFISRSSPSERVSLDARMCAAVSLLGCICCRRRRRRCCFCFEKRWKNIVERKDDRHEANERTNTVLTGTSSVCRCRARTWQCEGTWVIFETRHGKDKDRSKLDPTKLDPHLRLRPNVVNWTNAFEVIKKCHRPID